MTNSPDASFDILFLLSISNKKYTELHFSEISMLAYLGLLLSIYDGHKSGEWGYSFSYHSLGGPSSPEIIQQLQLLTEKGIVDTSSNQSEFYSVFYEPIKQLNMLMTLSRFSWRTKYLQAGFDACLTKSLPVIFRAVKQEPGLANAELLNRKTVLHEKDSAELYSDFGAIRQAVGDLRDEIIIPASIWIDYLLFLDKQKEGEL